MKSSGSPCPLDQMSIIYFKRCPYLRSFMLEICTEVLRSNILPTEWIKADTILIHKRVTPIYQNCRPITLEPVSLKPFTSLLRNRVFMYLINTQFTESRYQKGFMPGMSGTFEIEQMSHIINQSRKQQRCVTIILIDLEKAFDEVHYSLIQSVLRFHHIPDEISYIVKLLYNDFCLLIITNDFYTKYIDVEKGVFQGDSFSSLIFNLIRYTFI